MIDDWEVRLAATRRGARYLIDHAGGHSMYPSGRWEGFWVQEYFGRQTMREFELRFADGAIAGGGKDIVGRFTFSGAYDRKTGRC